jgi:outer membrane lipoprotein-sorting protein
MFFNSCSAKSTKPTNQTPEIDKAFSSAPPFPTKEPENYRAVRTQTFTDSSGKSTTTKTTIAKLGVLRREERQTDSSPAIVLLDISEGQFILFPNEKIYSAANETGSQSLADPSQFETSANRLLHTDSTNTTYEKLGTEEIRDRSLIKYRVVVNSFVGSSVSLSETLIWIDETLGMPIKSETASKDGNRSTMELIDISTEVDKSVFQLPTDYQRVAPAEFQRRLRRN